MWILDTLGRTGIITAGIVIQRGRVERVEVLVFRERRGQGVQAASFTRQFEGAALTDRGGLDRRIDGITGATISVRAVTNLARLALYLDRRVSDADTAVEKP